MIMVVIYHYVTCQRDTLTGKFYSLMFGPTYLFWSGVDLFFVLSGFLIGGIIFDFSKRESFLTTFFVRRAARILPIYITLLLLFLVAKLFLPTEGFRWLIVNEMPWYTYWTFTQNIAMGLNADFGCNFLAVTWSLAVEEQFYVALPLMAIWLSREKFKSAVVVCIIVAPFLRLAFPGFHASVNMPFRMDSLLLGVVLASVYRSQPIMELLVGHIRYVWTVFITLSFGLLLISSKGIGREFLAPSVIAFFYATAIFLSLAHQGNSISSFLRAGWLRAFGKYSYGIYLYHQLVAGLMHGVFRATHPSIATIDGILVTVIAAIVTFVLAMMSYHTIEKYFLSIGRRFEY